MYSAKGKPEKKAVFSLHCGDETTTYYNRAFPFPLPIKKEPKLLFLKAVP